jgi:hypothetical protein
MDHSRFIFRRSKKEILNTTTSDLLFSYFKRINLLPLILELVFIFIYSISLYG